MTRSNTQKKTGTSELSSLRGTIRQIFFTSDRFTTGRIVADDKSETPFAGKFGGMRERDRVVLYGDFTEHAKYGRQFAAQRFEYDITFTADGIVNYISSNPAMKGIGISRAVKIAQFCGDSFDDIVTNTPDRLTSIPGVTSAIAMTLHREWTKHREVNKCMTRLAAYDLSHNQIMALVKKYGNNAVRIIEENPYRLIEEVPGYGFKKADILARKAGTRKSSPQRIRAALIYTLECAIDDGDCLVEQRDLIGRANKILILDSLNSHELIESQLENLVKDSDDVLCIPLDNQFFIALKSIYEMEKYVGQIFTEFSGCATSLTDYSGDMLPSTLNLAQKEAVLNAMRHKISLVTGGAGTGKTYTVSSIVDIYRDADLSIVLAAPTGKAAKRMEQATGMQAYTIHRLLGYDGISFKRGPDAPIDADVIVLDEVSMLDVPLCWQLFQAIDFARTNLVLVGDHNQLPPVGPGNILRDVIQQKLVPTTFLTEVVRQAGTLKENSISILSGRVPKNTKANSELKEWFVVDKFKEPDDILKFILLMYESVLSEKLGFDIVRDVQLLAPMKKGVLGVDNLNIELQRLIQKKCFHNDIPVFPPGRRPSLYVNDKVICTKNNYELNVMNGAVGYIRRIDPTDGGIYYIEFDDGTRQFTGEDMRSISLAFASTIHKMQGSECECVIAVIHKSQSFMHHRNLFYTAVTRAKKSAIIIGDRWGINDCAAREFTDKRKTFLNLEGFIPKILRKDYIDNGKAD